MTSQTMFSRLVWALPATFAISWSTPTNAGSDPVLVTVTEPEAGTYVASGIFRVAADPTHVWVVLRDYNGMTKFLSAVTMSRVEDSTDGKTIVDQELVAHVLFLRQHMHTRLAIHDEQPDKILFVDLLHRDFIAYEGAWKVTPEAAGSLVEYTLHAEPMFWAPHEVAAASFHSEAVDLLNALRAEILRRSMQ